MGYLGKIFSGFGKAISRNNASLPVSRDTSGNPSSLPASRQLTNHLEKRKGLDEEMYSANWVALDQTTTVMVEEMANAEEEAEVFLLLGRTDMAISVLRHHIETHHDKSPHAWMTLLDIFHAQGMLGEFEKLAARIRTNFNISQPTWESVNMRNVELSGLERLPHLLGKITVQWRDPGCHAYLYGLIQDDREGKREGFQQEVFREILFLISILEFKSRL